ncbi:hypothetical protein K2173_006295 [Erythroxylum novogranatense]|uniref:ATP-dependent DNA helicase n=1 Tax=Erythroxylum novogranatense TaxID=1862640 RepID=A0AAV8TEC0_9ROSI|nr:hypothetical protein K2173_006295 [Erythroxylum novogranatense]
MKKSALPLKSISGNEKQITVSGKEGLVKLLRWHFGHSDFRGKQLDAIQAVLCGRDCFCLMPTGGGKSMCYQIPALARPGRIVLVISPLIALMENQVMALKEKGIAAEYLSSTQASHIKSKIHEDLDSGKPSTRLLYVTPELIATPQFMSKLTKIHARGLLNLIAIDEAHCISTWGHDFRPAYRNLSSLRNRIPDVPILALTATAVPKVQKDVIGSLCLQDPLVLKSSFNRPNIYYEVRYKDLLDDAFADLSSVLKSSSNVCAIVYCLERTTCDGLSAYLSKNGISSAAYHAGLNNKMRSSVLNDWISSKIQVVVATVAFGMGIDRKDVRIVCHFNIPKSMEAFYQESGRAGRDQLPSKSLLYYGVDDRKRMEFILRNSESKKLQSSSSPGRMSEKCLSDFSQMVEYCEGSGCRRKKILESFGEEVSPSLCNKSCDACKNPNLIVKHLEELKATYAVHQRCNLSQVLINSSNDMTDREQSSEFWNRDDEASCSEEDISETDEDEEDVTNLSRSRLSKKLGISAKIELLEHAEKSYYHKQNADKQDKKLDKNAITQTLREGSKQRLLNALKQAQQRLGNLSVDFETSASLLESECYKKYGKSGKTFYISQLASTVRWLSTTNSTELRARLAIDTPSPTGNVMSEISMEQKPPKTSNADISCSISSGRSIRTSPSKSASQSTKLPSLPSFSEFVNSCKRKGQQLNAPQNQSPRSMEKRVRLQ